MDESQKWVCITGAAGGVGQAVAQAMTSRGWQVVAVGRSAARLRDTFADAHLQIEADVSTSAGVKTVFATLAERGVTATALAHCVGNIRLGAIHRMKETDFVDCLNANLVSAYHTLAGFVGALRDARQPGSRCLCRRLSERAARVTGEVWGMDGGFAAIRPLVR